MTAPVSKQEPARPAPPPLLLQQPLCPVCGEDVYAVADGGYECERCHASWPLEVDGQTDGQWLYQEGRCAATVQPWAENIWVSAIRQRQVFQCVLEAGHEERESMHAHPEVTGAVAVRGWR